MKHILIAFLIALGLGLIFTSKSQVGEPYIKLNENEPLLFDSITSIFVKEKVEEISAKNQFVPLFFVFEGKLYFIKSNTDRVDDSLYVGNKFGIIGQNGEVILEQKYDKIYNPNFTITNCLEIAQNGKVGLINLKTNKIIEPQFEYIVPSGNIPSNIAFGLKGNDWYELNSETMQQTPSPNYSPEEFLSELDMEFTMNKTDYFIKNEVYITKLNELLEDYSFDDFSSNGAFIIPSFGKLIGNNEVFTDAVINEYSGTVSYKIKNQFSKKIKDFIFSVYNILNYVSGGRDGYYYNYSTLTIHKVDSLHYYENLYINTLPFEIYESLNFDFLNDSVIALKNISENSFSNDKSNYKLSLNDLAFYNDKIYYKIGSYKLENLYTNRIFSITKYEKLNDSLIKGTYIVWDPPKNKPKINEDEDEMYSEFYSNLFEYQLPSIKHLNLMKNEILADYGYIFKDKEWNEYFSKMKWYKPQNQDVSKYLTEVDKHNINYIDKLIKKMKGKEKKFTKPEKYDYPIAG